MSAVPRVTGAPPPWHPPTKKLRASASTAGAWVPQPRAAESQPPPDEPAAVPPPEQRLGRPLGAASTPPPREPDGSPFRGILYGLLFSLLLWVVILGMIAVLW